MCGPTTLQLSEGTSYSRTTCPGGQWGTSCPVTPDWGALIPELIWDTAIGIQTATCIQTWWVVQQLT